MHAVHENDSDEKQVSHPVKQGRHFLKTFSL
jgi:hypothetical protein